MADLEAFITNRSGSISRRLMQYTDLETVASLNDSRTGKLTAPMQDYNALNQASIEDMKPLRRFLKVSLRVDEGLGPDKRRPIFWGPIVKPVFDFAQGTVEINAHDPSFWLKHHFLRKSDPSVTDSQPLNGDGAWELVQAAFPTGAEITAGVPPPGIVRGIDGSYAEALSQKAEKATAVWDTLLEMAGAISGPDFDLEPIDEDYDPDTTWEPGVFCRFNAFQDKGSDRTDEIIFHYGWGRDNLENFVFEPDGALVKNRFIAATDKGGGQRIAYHNEGINRDGIVEEWYTATNAQRGDALREYALGQVRAYGHPPEIFTVTTRPEAGVIGGRAGTPFRWPKNFAVGDRIRAVAKKGEMVADVTGRVVTVTTRQADAAGGVRQDLECIPTILGRYDVYQEYGGGV